MLTSIGGKRMSTDCSETIQRSSLELQPCSVADFGNKLKSMLPRRVHLLVVLDLLFIGFY